MNNDKNTDRLLGKKLGSYEAKPSKLTFDGLHKNYLKEKKLRFRTSIIRGASILSAIAGMIIITYIFTIKNNNTTSNTKTIAQNTNSEIQNIQSENSPNTENTINPNNTGNKPVEGSQQHDENKTAVTGNLNNTESAEEKPGSDKKAGSTSQHDEAITSKPIENAKSETGILSPAATKRSTAKLAGRTIAASTNEKNSVQKEAVLSLKADAKVKPNSINKKVIAANPPAKSTTAVDLLTLASTKKELSKKPGAKKENPIAGKTVSSPDAAYENDEENITGKNNEVTGRKAETQLSTGAASAKNKRAQKIKPGSAISSNKLKANALPGTNTAINNNTATNNNQQTPLSDNKNDNENNTQDNGYNKTKSERQSQNALTITTGTASTLAENNETVSGTGEDGLSVSTKSVNAGENESVENEQKTSATPVSVDVNDQDSEPLSIPTTTSLPSKKTSGFIISTEVSMNSVKSKITPANNSDYAALYSGANTVSKSKVYSGAALLGFKYKNAGFNTGVGMLNIETTIDSKPLAKTYSTYSMSLNITHRDSLIPIFNDTNVVGHYTVVITKIDTSYNVSGTNTYVVVNGDTVSPQSYISNVRFVTIPLQLNYSFNLFKSKLVIEPQVGLQIGIPQRSYQFVSGEPYDMQYAKTQKPLKPRLLFYDLSLKVNYRFGRNAFVYLKQGYFFNSKNIYDNSYLLKYTLKNIYTAFGVSVLIN